MKRKKIKEYKKSQITATNIFNFIFYIKNTYFAQRHSLKK